MYTLTNVTKKYIQSKREVIALNDVTLEIPDGQLVAIQGPTGGGKSTLLQMLGALDRPTSGSVELETASLSKLRRRQAHRHPRQRDRVRLPGLQPHPDAHRPGERRDRARAARRRAPTERKRRAAEALASVGLADRGSHLPSELSGGQQQRVAIARALVKDPDVLLADEPTGNLDEETRDEIMDLLEGLWRDRGLTLIIVTHDSAVAKRAQRRLHIKHGQVKEVA